MTRVYLGLGSNLNAMSNMARALESLRADYPLLKSSPVFRNQAEGFDGPPFLNMVVSFDCRLSLKVLWQALRDLEAYCYRDRTREQGMGSRTMDLDLLLFGDRVGNIDGVELPRPEIFAREFVWRPLSILLQNQNDMSALECQVFQQIQGLPEYQADTQMVPVVIEQV